MRRALDLVSTRHVLQRCALVGALLVALLWSGFPAEAAPGRFHEVDRLPLYDPPEPTERSGWLILNPVTRRGYQVFEVARPSPANPRTVIQSFDLDTLAPRRRVELAGVPIVGGIGNVNVAENTASAAELVHAVDEEAGRLYLALSFPQAFDQVPQTLLAGPSLSPDGRRPLARFVAIDEATLDRCGGEPDCPFAASFRQPPGEERLHAYWVAGMAVDRHHVEAGEVGRLIVLFAAPQPSGTVFYDHTLTQWDPSRNPTGAPLEFSATAPNDTEPVLGLTMPGRFVVQQAAAAGVPRRLDACSRAALAASGSGGQGTHQWGLLVKRDAVWTACQATDGIAPASAAVSVGRGAEGHFDQAAPTSAFPVGGRLADVLVDGGRGRLLLRTFAGGHRLRVFDTASLGTLGHVELTVGDAASFALGLHPVSGRLYALIPDYDVFLGGKHVFIEGGLQFGDPPAPLQNVHPDLAYPAGYRIQGDPVTGRVFVRFGHQSVHMMATDPGTEGPADLAPAPPEPFYRVFVHRGH